MMEYQLFRNQYVGTLNCKVARQCSHVVPHTRGLKCLRAFCKENVLFSKILISTEC